ncbi:excinuclease ABC subunit A [Corynebacterium sp. HMSC058E07]|uniref:ATP-binding cassette domain-containing protein n=1 Tax=Corynebacterium sp. HMSC058E07 TaxID=1715157 RepID=UPI0008A64FEA|nr:excinuclease ABC subunit UvrA [Corynebacterium sp. HMSC058E07]OFM59332.1 excinuclease ABC subunit A [Corynebacterium sp. HMSC058E07]
MIRVRDAHLRNLKHQDVELPRNALVAVTGVSGSGKSSLAFGTLHGEAQRRYLESVAPFARRLIGGAVDPRVGSVDGLPPTVALEQGARAGGARSTVGTVSNLSNTVRLLYSRCGEYPAEVRKRHGGRLASDCFSPNTTAGMCPECQGTGVVHEPTEQTMVPDPSLSIDEGAIAAWPGAWLGKNFHDIVAELGFPMDVPWKDIPQADREWILFTDERPVVTIHPHRGADQIQRTYEGTWRSVASYLRKTLAETGSDSTRKRVLSFMRSSRCGVCAGRRLIVDALSVEYLGLPIDSLGALPLEDVLEHFAARRDSTALTAAETSATAEAERASAAAEAERILLDQAIPTLESVVDLGLGHLSLDRAAATLSAGEMQRLRLASQLRSGLFGVAYVLDEPSAGLHPEERRAVMKLIRGFLDAGNSVLLVEHDMHLVAEADWIVDVGPGAGELGGEILYSGPAANPYAAERPGPAAKPSPAANPTPAANPNPAEESRGAGGSAGLAELDSPTGRALAAGPLELVSDADARTPSGKLRLTDINERTLNSLNVDFGLGAFTAITGVSGSGKSTLLHVLADTLSEQVKTAVNDGDVASKGKNPAQTEIASPNPSATLSATLSADKTIDRLVQISQKPIGRTPRSCLATYTGLFDKVRKIFAQTDAAKQRGWTVSRFSYNVTQGRCPTCSGEGQIEVELVFLPGSYTPCPDCHGARYNAETLAVTWNGRTIADVLGLTVAEAREVFADEAAIARALQALSAVGLDYLRLGQPATELSGGEAQRIKLATELQRAQRGHTVYLMDEPTTGLHPADVDLLVTELQRLVDSGNTVVVVEHDMRVVAQTDRLIEMGPGAGARGGRVVADGSPAAVAETDTATGRVLAERSQLTSAS